MERKKRHGCLTAWLSFLILASIYRIYIYSPPLWFRAGDASRNQNMAQGPIWVTVFLITGAALTIVFSIALFRWKKWAFWGYCALNTLSFAVYLSLGEQFIDSLIWLAAIAVLYGVLQIGKDNKGWTYLK